MYNGYIVYICCENKKAFSHSQSLNSTTQPTTSQTVIPFFLKAFSVLTIKIKKQIAFILCTSPKPLQIKAIQKHFNDPKEQIFDLQNLYAEELK